MYLKLIVQFILIVIPSISVLGQSDIFGLGSNALIDPYDMHHILKNGQKNKIDLLEVEGSPYENESFIFGKAVDKLTNQSHNYYLRYNAYDDEVQMKSSLDEKNIYRLIQASNISAIINNKEYHYLSYSEEGQINEGYFILVGNDGESHIYLRKTKRFKPGQPAKDSFRAAVPSAFKDNKDRFYFKKEDILYPIATKKKAILEQFSDKKNELKKFMKNENIDLSKEEDIVKLMKYYASLTSN